MSARAAIEALKLARFRPEPVLMPSAAGLGARLEAVAPEILRQDPQRLADACLSAARYLGADAVWVSMLAADGGPDLSAAFLADAANRAIAAARAERVCVVELRGPLHRALQIGGALDEALKQIKPAMIAEFEAIANLRPDIIVLAEPPALPDHAESRVLARLYGALKRLAEHYDIVKGMRPAQPGMTGPSLPDLAFPVDNEIASGRCARAIAPDWASPAAFSATVLSALEEARASGTSLIVSGDLGLTGEAEPHLAREAAQGLRERV